MQLAATLRRIAAVALLCAAGAAAAIPADADDEAAGALVGELMFRADLLDSLDRLCRRGSTASDWHAALPALPREATTPELLALSRRLAADAGQRVLQENGGCTTPAFSDAYDESRQTFDELIQRWRQR
jgi:hypothetical protein